MFIQYWFLLPGALGGVTRNVPVLSGGRKKKLFVHIYSL